MSVRLTLIAATLVFLAAFASAQQQPFHLESHVYITTLQSGTPPTPWDNAVLFSYRPDRLMRHVGISFRHENFARVHTMLRNQYGVYVILYVPPEGIDELIYRFVTDGLWISDPLAHDRLIDEGGTVLSRVSISGAFPVAPESPVITDRGRVRLSYIGNVGRRVYVSGDFTGWDPFLYRLSEEQPGSYAIEVHLPPGLHGYVFVIDGDDRIDPLNPVTSVRRDGKIVSVVDVPASAVP